MGRTGEVLVLLFVVWLLGASSETESLSSDGVALLSFKFNLLSDPMAALASWNLSDLSPCGWNGVVCAAVDGESASRVVGLILPQCQLLGSIPDELGSITHLRHVELSRNLLNGTIPAGLFQAAEMKILSLGGNELSGEVPEEIGNLRQLVYLNLTDNALEGGIPAGLTSIPALRVVSLGANYFTGEIPAGFGLGGQPLVALDLSSNLLNGSLPPEIGGLVFFNVSTNRLSGQIPPVLGRNFLPNATLDISYNNFSGPLPETGPFLTQRTQAFAGNPWLCGKQVRNLCSIPATLSNPPNDNTSTPSSNSPPAFAAIPENLPQPALNSTPAVPGQRNRRPVALNQTRRNGLKPAVVAGIVVGDFAALGLIAMLLVYNYQRRKKENSKMVSVEAAELAGSRKNDDGKWSCLGSVKKGGGEENSSSDGSSSDSDEEPAEQKPGRLITVDGDKPELDLDRLLKASAYVLGTGSGSGIVYKAVLEDGSVLAVRRVGESVVYRMKDFEKRVRTISKLRHPNLVRLRGFYWGSDEKLLIYNYVSNGSLAAISSRKPGSSPVQMKWEVRLRIGQGIARGVAYLHEKKCIHGNLKPSKVLLGPDMEPQISDFGVDRLIHDRNDAKGGSNSSSSATYLGGVGGGSMRSNYSVTPELPIGTSPLGGSSRFVAAYQAPEAYRTLKPSQKWDVYSFGVIFLELVTGRTVTEREVGMWNDGASEDRRWAMRLVDMGFRPESEEKEEVLLECMRIGFSCVSVVPQKRPCMKEVVQVLDQIPASCSFLNSSSFSYI